MTLETTLDWVTKDWTALLRLLPKGWREKAKELGALLRLRKIGSADELLRLLLLHVGHGVSLRQAVARAEHWGLPKISDVALFKRMRQSGAWLRWMCEELAEEMGGRSRWEVPGSQLRMIAVDGSDIVEPGATGSSWKLHYAIELPGLMCTHAEVTERSVGESLCRYPVKSGDLFTGDRGFCREGQVKHVLENGGHVLLRWHSTSMPLYRPGRKKALDVLGWLRKKAGGEGAQVDVRTKGGIALRLCALAVDERVAERERAKVRESARKQGRPPSAQSLELAGYIVLVTSLPAGEFGKERVFPLYRLRWQIELAFKRLKSLLEAGHVPKTDPASARAWMQAKMLTCLLIEKLLVESEVFSPWGFPLPGEQPLG